MHLLLRLIGLLLLIFHFSDARASYFLSRPDRLSSGVNTTFAFHWFGNTYSDINLTAGILFQDIVIAKATQVFQNDTIGIISIPAISVNSSSYYSYSLFVNASAGNEVIFTNSFYVYTFQFGIGIYTFIETDKKNYRPQETVKIRVITVYRDLKPNKGPIHIFIKDSSNNIVKQIQNQKTELGVFVTEVLLPVNPMFGTWSVSAGPNMYEDTEYFSVLQNESPSFDVTIVAPSYYYKPNRKDYIGKVFATYNYGRPVKGHLNLSLNFDNSDNMMYFYVYPYDDITGANKTFEIYGSVSFSFSYNEVFKCPFWRRLILTASVTEEKTGKTVTTSWFIKRATSEYRMFVISQPDYFIPGDNITAKIQIQRTDDLPLTQEERIDPVSVKIIAYPEITTNFTIPESGIINIEIPYTILYSSYFYIYVQATYKGSFQNWNIYNTYAWYWNPTISIIMPDRPLQVGIPFTVRVGTVPEVQYVYYTVIAGGVIVTTGKTNSSSFILTAENSWLPSAQVNVYFLNSGNLYGSDIVIATKTIRIKGYKVALSWSKSKAKPSENVSLTISNIKETPAIVGLNVVDINDKLSGNTNTLSAKMDNMLYWNYFSSSSDGTINYASAYSTPVITSSSENNDPISQPVNVKTIIPDTWIWLQTNVSSGSGTSLQVTVPRKIIPWFASALVMTAGLGLGVSEQYSVLEVFQPLLLTLNAPRTVIRGEKFLLKVTLESYISTDLQVAVILDPSSSFEIIVPDNNINSVAGQRSVFIPSKETIEVLFPINPKKLGEMSLTVQANSLGASDSATHKVLVKAEGIQNFYSTGVILKAGTSVKKLSFSFPSDVIVDTKQASVSVTGNFLAPSIKGLQSLIQLPTGCGEQNMINFAPDVYVLQYLIATNQITEDVRAKAIHFMERGYQTELRYWRSDGSFSAFGNLDYSGSTWLSAFVLRCFLQARQLISISEDVLYRTTEWLFQNLNEETGIFHEPGRVIHTSLQGGSDGEIARTAYILISLLEDQGNKNVSYSMNRTIQYLENNMEEGITSNHTLSVVAYALSMANSSKATAALSQLDSRANRAGGQKYWSSGKVTSNYWQPPPADIETAAYALLSHCQLNRIAEGVPIMNWLSQHRNHLGGYSSTQDTIMAMQALTKFMTLVPSSNNPSLTVSVTDSGAIVPNTFHITNENLLVVQTQQIYTLQPLELIVFAAGRGAALLQLNVMYNSKASSRRKREMVTSEVFKLSATVDDSDSLNRISVNVCSSYQGPESETGMVLWEVPFLSGFELDPVGIGLNGSFKLVEIKDEKVFMYFDSMNRNEICVVVPMVRTSLVAGSQAAAIKIYDYYNPGIYTMRTYNSEKLNKVTVCAFCELNCNACISNVMMPMTSSTTIPPKNSLSTTTAKPLVSSATASTLAMLGFCVSCMWNLLWKLYLAYIFA